MNLNVISRIRMSLSMSSWSGNPAGSTGESDHSGNCFNNGTGSVSLYLCNFFYVYKQKVS